MAKTPYPLPDFPHLEFKRCWTLSESVNRNLGQCVAIVNCLGGVPVDPELQRELRTVSLQRGAVATTAIEGNTLSEAELQTVLSGKELPKSREYQAVEVLNAGFARACLADAGTPLLTEVLVDDDGHEQFFAAGEPAALCSGSSDVLR